IETSADLRRRMSIVPDGLRNRPGRDPREDLYPGRLAKLFPGRLAMIAADAATQTKFVFPRMAGLVYRDPDAVNPAEFVRASMSIPGFFHPFVRPRLDPVTDAIRAAWMEDAGFELGN